MYNEGRVFSLIVHLRPQAPPEVGTPDAAPAENQGFSPGDPDLPRPRCVPARSCSGGGVNEHGVTVYEVLPEVNGLPVINVTFDVDDYFGVVDVSRVEVRVWFERVEVRVWFDRDGNYKGEYSDLPKLELGEFWNQSNVPVKYYGEW